MFKNILRSALPLCLIACTYASSGSTSPTAGSIGLNEWSRIAAKEIAANRREFKVVIGRTHGSPRNEESRVAVSKVRNRITLSINGKPVGKILGLEVPVDELTHTGTNPIDYGRLIITVFVRICDKCGAKKADGHEYDDCKGKFAFKYDTYTLKYKNVEGPYHGLPHESPSSKPYHRGGVDFIKWLYDNYAEFERWNPYKGSKQWYNEYTKLVIQHILKANKIPFEDKATKGKWFKANEGLGIKEPMPLLEEALDNPSMLLKFDEILRETRSSRTNP